MSTGSIVPDVDPGAYLRRAAALAGPYFRRGAHAHRAGQPTSPLSKRPARPYRRSTGRELVLLRLLATAALAGVVVMFIAVAQGTGAPTVYGAVAAGGMLVWPRRLRRDPAPTVDDVGPLFDVNEPAELRDSPVLATLQAELNEVMHERDELQQALDFARPAPNQYVLGTVMEQKWFKAPDDISTTERWARVAETAIDYVRGLWPLDLSAGFAAMARHDAECEPYEPCDCRIADRSPVVAEPPKTVVGGGEKAADPVAATGAPTPDDTQTWRHAIRICRSCGAVTSPVSANRGWCQVCETADAIDTARVAAEKHLAARADAYLEDLARDLASAVVLAGWRPPTTTTTGVRP